MQNIIVIGAGQAGAACVAKLRSAGFKGEITLIGQEPVPPYQRPPLSKGYLLGELGLERLYLRPERFYDENNITLILDTTVDSIDPAAKTITAGGRVMGYDALVLTTGATPRHLPASMGGDLQGVHVMRRLADIDAMAPHMTDGQNALIVGGGYIGLESAAICRKRGMNVTLIEAAPRILQRVAAAETSAYFRDLHRAQGVDLRENTGLTCLTGAGGKITGAILADHCEIPVDLAVIGIGVTPATALAETAGLTIDNGIKVNAAGQTSNPAIYAAGDCASFPYQGGRIRLESVQNAIDQAEAVACAILGQDVTYTPMPWFWSDQYDVKLQIAGLNTGYDRVVMRNAGTSVSHWYYAGDRFLAIDAMNDPRAYMVGKRLLEAGTSPDPALVGNAETDLKSLLQT
jgi:3-phenylpropionate/trans-cinnamate dioxygenase ferredoxin reductase subunit